MGIDNNLYRFQIRFHEVDRAGVLFFGHLFTHAHNAYEHFMNHLGLNLNREWSNEGYVLPIVKAEADYQAPLRHSMEINVTLAVFKLGEKSFTTIYKFWHGENQLEDQLYAQVRLVHCCVDTTTGKSRKLPDDLRVLLEQWLQCQI